MMIKGYILKILILESLLIVAFENVFSYSSAGLKPPSLYRYFRYKKNSADRKSSL